MPTTAADLCYVFCVPPANPDLLLDRFPRSASILRDCGFSHAVQATHSALSVLVFLICQYHHDQRHGQILLRISSCAGSERIEGFERVSLATAHPIIRLPIFPNMSAHFLLVHISHVFKGLSRHQGGKAAQCDGRCECFEFARPPPCKDIAFCLSLRGVRH